jgi:hypothetical protein
MNQNHHVQFNEAMPAQQDPYAIYPANETEVNGRGIKRRRTSWMHVSQSDMSGQETEPWLSNDSLTQCQPDSFFANLAAEAQLLLDSRRDWSQHVPSCSSISSSASTVSSSSFSSAPSISSSATFGAPASFDYTFHAAGTGFNDFRAINQSGSADRNGALDSQSGSTRWVGAFPWAWEAAPTEELEEFSLGSGQPYMKFD